MKAKVQTLRKDSPETKKLVVAQKTALGQVQVNTILVRSDNCTEEDEEDYEEN